MPSTSRATVTQTSRSAGSPQSPAGNYVQRGRTVTTVRETERTTTRNRRGEPITKTKVRTVYYVDGKAVKLNWFDRLRIRFMSTYEKQAFLGEKLLKQERKGNAIRTTTTTTSTASTSRGGK